MEELLLLVHTDLLCTGEEAAVCSGSVCGSVNTTTLLKNNVHLNGGDLELMSVALPSYLQFSNKGLIVLFLFCVKLKVVGLLLFF